VKLAGDRCVSVIRRSTIALAFALLTQFAYAESEYVASWGPEVGAAAPILAALDQDGNQQNLSSLSGSNGLLFVFNRSVDW
jgi:hypothetical protein